MAGQPKARKHRAILDKLGEEEVFAQLMVLPVRKFAESLGMSPPRLYEWLREEDGRQDRYTSMKKLKAHMLAEESVEILDECDPTDNAVVGLAKARSEVRRWYAGKLNRDEYGSDSAVNVQVNTHNDMRGAHLTALRTSGHMLNAEERAAKMRDNPLSYLSPAERKLIEDRRAEAGRQKLIASGMTLDRSDVQDADYEIVDGD